MAAEGQLIGIRDSRASASQGARPALEAEGAAREGAEAALRLRLSLDRQSTDLSLLVEQVVSEVSAWSDRHVVSFALPPSLEACVDPIRFEQVLTNLLDNAIKYSPGGGVIEVVVSRAEAALELSVRDHGLGIPLEKRDQIFERFYQAHTDGHISGLGLGLYISRQIIDLHGGEIRAEFPPDGGTRFVVRLPLEQGVAAAHRADRTDYQCCSALDPESRQQLSAS